jgi:RNA polymerase sigma-70 factor (ECF subfamily)
VFRRDPLANPELLIRRVYAYVAYRIGDGPEAEDVTSDVFERALRYQDSFDSKRGEPVAWLLGIARRALYDRKRPDDSPLTEETADLAVVDLQETIVDRVWLRNALMALGDRERELLALRYGADLSARQIGDLLEMRTNAVEVAIHRALARLRQSVAGEEAELQRSGGASARAATCEEEGR